MARDGIRKGNIYKLPKSDISDRFSGHFTYKILNSGPKTTPKVARVTLEREYRPDSALDLREEEVAVVPGERLVGAVAQERLHKHL